MTTPAKQYRVSVVAPTVSPEFQVRASNLDEDERLACYEIATAAASQVVFSQQVAEYLASISSQIAVHIAGHVAADIAAQLVEAAAPAIITAARSATQADTTQLATALADSVRTAMESIVAVVDVGRYSVEFERDNDGRIISADKRPA